MKIKNVITCKSCRKSSSKYAAPEIEVVDSEQPFDLAKQDNLDKSDDSPKN